MQSCENDMGKIPPTSGPSNHFHLVPRFFIRPKTILFPCLVNPSKSGRDEKSTTQPRSPPDELPGKKERPKEARGELSLTVRRKTLSRLI